jgi:hypothetical protein
LQNVRKDVRVGILGKFKKYLDEEFVFVSWFVLLMKDLLL